MPHSIELILTLTGALTAALLFGALTQRLKLSPIVGYLLAGIVVGPFTPGFVAHAGITEQLAEVGVVLLMFGVGLHFHAKELLAVRRIALPGAAVQIGVATALGAVVANVAGYELTAGLVFGVAISVASTVVLLRVLSDADALQSPGGHVAVGWLIVEDVFTVLVLVLLPVLAKPEVSGDPRQIALAVGWAVLKIALLAAFTLVAGRRVIPLVLDRVAKTRSRELFTLTVLVLALGIAVGSAMLFGASMALGAFLAGMVVGQSEFSSRAASEALPMRDAFAVLFFVSVGMLFDPTALVEHTGLVLGALAVVLIGKPIAAFAVVKLLGRPTKTGLVVAAALSQIGEFSFILATTGHELRILPESAMPALVATAIVSISLSPLLYRTTVPLERILARWGATASAREAPEGSPPSERSHRAVVVGYGPVGRSLTRLLRANAVEPTVVELNHETVRALRADGIRAIYGDATQFQILEEAGVQSAGSLVFAASGTPAEDVVRAAKELNPELEILARTTYVRDIPTLMRAGATVVFSAEREVALAMAEHILHRLGATGEQLDRARDKVRRALD